MVNRVVQQQMPLQFKATIVDAQTWDNNKYLPGNTVIGKPSTKTEYSRKQMSHQFQDLST